MKEYIGKEEQGKYYGGVGCVVGGI